MSRADLERLLDRGKIDAADQVSFQDGPWIAIGDFLAQGSRPAAPVEAPPPPAAPKPVAKTGTMRLLQGNKVFSSLSREQIADLRAKQRVVDDDLVCTLNGPWMRLGDFFSQPPAAVAQAILEPEEEVFQGELVEGPEEEVEVIEAEPGGDDDLEVLHVPGGHQIDDLLRPTSHLADEWYVKVKGIHSAPLKKQNIKMLFQAREITLDCPAHHPTWRAEHWKPIYAIPELADIGVP
jgi:hypothetical protein